MRPYYEQDGITIYHGDCREVLADLETASVDLVLTDPPYAISQDGVVHVSQVGKGSRNFDFFPGDTDWPATREMVTAVASECLRVCKPPRSMYWWCGHRQFGDLVNLFEAADLETRFLVWSKLCPSPPPPGAGWPSGAELCVYAYERGRKWAYTPANVPRSNVIVADSYRHGQPGKRNHPTQKRPVLKSVPMLASSIEGDMVLDPFMGSGTTLEVAKLLGRRAIGIDLEESYCEDVVNRLRQGVLGFTNAT